jgi:proliferating cell nuclear antigen PCNA
VNNDIGKMTVIFSAKTREGYVVKILAELLQNNIKTACFEIDEEGIRLCMMDHHRTILIDLFLQSDNFSVYKYKNEKKMYIGVNLTHFHKMLKSIKKRDSIQLFINDDTSKELGIKVIPKENNRVTTSYVKILDDQNLMIKLPTGYDKPIIVPSGEYQKMIKSLVHIGNVVNISSSEFKICFSCDAGGVMKRTTEFGDGEDSDDEEKDPKITYKQDFDSEQLTRITKLAGLGTNMQIYPKEGLPLLFKSNVGSLGKISIYIKSREQIDTESHGVESDEEDNDY